MLKVVVSFFFLTIICVLSAEAQVTTGSLEGHILDQDGEPIPQAGIRLMGPSLQGDRVQHSLTDGYFLIWNLPVGTYEVTVSHDDYQDAIHEGVAIHLGQTTSLGALQLQKRTSREEHMIVTARRVHFDPSSTMAGAYLLAKDYATLPIARDFQSLATLVPHANESFTGDPVNFSGATGQENHYYIDGIDVSEPVDNSPGTHLPHNFVREVQVRTGGYEAKYRASLGGTINAVTYSGGNEFKNRMFGYFVNNRFSGDRQIGALEPSTGDFAYYDVGTSLGGPIRKDRLWYFLAYNPTFEREDFDVPSLGFLEDHSTRHSFAGKLTWRASDTHTFVCTAVGDPTERRAIGEFDQPKPVPSSMLNPDPYLTDVRTGGVNVMLAGQHFLRDDLLLETSLSWRERVNKHTPATERGQNEVLFIDQETGEWSGGGSERIDDSSTVSGAGITGRWLTGDHELEAGIEYRDSQWSVDQRMEEIIRFSDDYYYKQVSFAKGQVGNRVLSSFLQDSWRFNDRLRINVGLRWDGQYFISSRDEVAQTILDQWQPRVGVVYQPGETGTQRITASCGRYYQDMAMNALNWHYNDQGAWHFIDYGHDPRLNPAGGDTTSFPYEIRPEMELEGQYYDEFILGYQRQLTDSSTLTVRGIHRTLRQVIEDGLDPETFDLHFGNPGHGGLNDYPTVQRDYTALQVSLNKRVEKHLHFQVSYVLSRSYGNYPGMFHEIGLASPNIPYFDYVETLEDAEGRLPNDRPHVFKLSGTYRLGSQFTVGTVGSLSSGTPKNELGAFHGGYPYSIFLQPRGTAGRTPPIWDLNLRFVYEPSLSSVERWRPRLTVDILHIASAREAVLYDYFHYFGIDDDGNQIDPNPTYNMPIRYQPPMAIRLGIEASF